MEELNEPNQLRIEKNVDESRQLLKRWKRLARDEAVEQKYDVWVSRKRKKDLVKHGLVSNDGMKGKKIKGNDGVLSNLEVGDSYEKASE